MDHNGYGGWGASGGGTPLDDGDCAESHHHHYCQMNVNGGSCTCYAGDQTNNNDYSQLRKQSNNKKKSPTQEYGIYGSYHEGTSSYHNNAHYNDAHYNNDHSQPESANDYSYQPSYAHQRTPSKPCLYCSGNSEGSDPGSCRQCNGHRACSFSSDSYRNEASSATRQGLYNGTPKIQVTAKILFGTVGAITDLKQKKASKSKK